MKKSRRRTGGRVIEVGNKIDKLKQAFEQISAGNSAASTTRLTPTNSTARRVLPQGRN